MKASKCAGKTYFMYLAFFLLGTQATPGSLSSRYQTSLASASLFPNVGTHAGAVLFSDVINFEVVILNPQPHLEFVCTGEFRMFLAHSLVNSRWTVYLRYHFHK